MSRFYAILGQVSPDFDGCELPPPDPVISRAVSYIEANCRRAITIDELSALCNLSRSHLFSRFKQVTGCTPIEYKHRAMVQRAQRLLIDEPSLSIEEVSERTGFESAAYFRRVFHAVTGLPPRDYRKIERGML
ncbi:MAG: helix-turn-helix transcriptional regulator [Clostridia bacterium]|nr:helix-turn-helix transcriptional regulator [Clostridia bacterium]